MTDETIQRGDAVQEMIVSLFDNDNRQCVERAGFFFGQAGVLILSWRFFTDFPLSDVGSLLSFMLDIAVRIFPVFAIIFAVVGVVQMGWYARRCWNTRSPSRMGGES